MNQLAISDQYPHTKNLVASLVAENLVTDTTGTTCTNLQCPCCRKKSSDVCGRESIHIPAEVSEGHQLATALTLNNAINTYATEFVSAWNVAIEISDVGWHSESQTQRDRRINRW